MAFSYALETTVSPGLRAYAKNTATLGDIRVRVTTGERVTRIGEEVGTISAASALQTQTATLRSTLASRARAGSFLQVAGSGLATIRTLLGDLRTLTSTANEAGRTGLSYATLDAQFQSTLRAIDQTVADTTFNGASILDGSAEIGLDPYLTIGATAGDSVSLALPDVSTSGLFGGSLSIGDAGAATAATSAVADAGALVDEAIAKVDAYLLRLEVADASTRATLYGLSSSISDLIGTDESAETRRGEALTLTQQSAAALLAQTAGLRRDLLGLLG